MQAHRSLNALLVGEVILGELVDRCGGNTNELVVLGHIQYCWGLCQFLISSANKNPSQSKGDIKNNVQWLRHLSEHPGSA